MRESGIVHMLIRNSFQVPDRLTAVIDLVPSLQTFDVLSHDGAKISSSIKKKGEDVF